MRIAMLGGSFNPIHNGHIAIAEALKTEFALDEILFIVAMDPPHKQVADDVAALKRYEMTKLALHGKPGIKASDIEMLRKGKSYTVDTVRELKARYAGAQIYCIVGADMLNSLASWYQPEALLRETAFIGVERPGVTGSLNGAAGRLIADYGADVRLSMFCGPDISSTMVREAVRDARPISSLVPYAVQEYIYESALYVPEKIVDMQEKLRATLKYERYRHTAGTMAAAIELAHRFGADAQKARIAALLHDCAKRSKQEQLELADKLGLNIGKCAFALLHGPLGALVAQREYSVTDEDILTAIRCHTTCRVGMSKLDKIIYLADKIEPTRDYDGLVPIREMAQSNLNKAVLMCMERNMLHVEQKGELLDNTILAAREYIINNEL